ncbi:hypothetical protein QR680_010171 [Steinernema hermaphroditum]|uniref:Uncharacterized protein n=1 Tax=Steinernema hermaphroditum TaxID=289476 RepID=A0AA39IN06_9BILA|nr:hypothetical protein QR680_010171 [Steinernema hermaphroditum]
MAQIGIMQLMVAPITVLGGMRRVFDVDPLNLTEISLKLASISIKVEAILSLVLAMNRLRMICGLKYPDAVHTVIVALSYTYGLGLFVVLMSPWANFRMPTGSFMGRYDFSLPLTYYAALSASSVMLCSTACTFAIYVVIICYLSRLRSQAVIIKHYKRERTILVYAVIRFVTDMTLLILFNFFKLPDEPWPAVISKFAQSYTARFLWNDRDTRKAVIIGEATQEIL